MTLFIHLSLFLSHSQSVIRSLYRYMLKSNRSLCLALVEGRNLTNEGIDLKVENVMFPL